MGSVFRYFAALGGVFLRQPFLLMGRSPSNCMTPNQAD
jgi:hypothetical protein